MAVFQCQRFEVLMAVIMKTAVCWDVTPCSLAKVCQCFRISCCLHCQGRPYSVTAHKTSVFKFCYVCYLSFGAKGHTDVGHSGTWEDIP